MVTRIGKVTKVYPGEGRVKVTFEDSGSSSLPLAVLTMNKEYSMPSVGDRVDREFGIDVDHVLGYPLNIARNMLALEIIEKVRIYEILGKMSCRI